MCLLNYNKEIKKYKHLTYAERTIRREIKRGLTINLTSEYEEIEVYSADIAQEEYEKNLKAKGQDLKIDSDIEIVKRIEKMIKEEKKSPEVIEYELKKEGLLDITGRTIRNYIYSGEVFDLTKEDMIYNKEYKTKN